MKVKKDKKVEKRPRDEESSLPTKEYKKSSKKPKLEKRQAENGGGDETEVVQTTPASDKPLKSVDVNIFKYFKDLTSEEEKTRLEAAVHLLQQIQRTKETDKRNKELVYCLKRLIRGCGASTNVSRSGFYTGLVGLFKSFNSKQLTMAQIFEILNKELHVGATVANKDDADAIVGKILVCGAILHSGRLNDVNSEDLEQITNILLMAARHRTYHASLAFGFLCEIIETLPQENFESNVWPLLQKELVKPWPKQTLQSVYCLISVHKKFPEVVNAKFFKCNFGGKELLNPESFQHLHKIFWQHSNTDILTHPAFECFGAYIASSKYLSQFWNEVVDPGLKNPTKLLEVETLKILTDIFDNLNVEKTSVHELLTDNFMAMFIEGLKTLKQKKDETLKAFYSDFLEALEKCCGKMNNDVNKVAVIKRLILPPGIFNIEKFTGHRVVHQLINTLGEEGVKEVFDLYKSIFLATLVKNVENSSENWLNFERLNAGYMLQHLLQHKSMQTAYQWREEQLKFLFSCGIFFVTDTGEICKKEHAGEFSKDFAEQCKKMFFTCLQSKLSDIEKEQSLLFNLAEFCQEKILKKHAAKYFRIQKFDDSLQGSWKNMFVSVSQTQRTTSEEKVSKKKKPDKLQTVFNILLLNMGLQLFREPEMADSAIKDLLKCLEKTKHPKQSKKKTNITKNQLLEQEEEPDWIEVLVDLFLHLLSQNNNALRNIVNALFPHLCNNLSLTAVHQILSMLDMKDGNNPLSTKNEDEEEDESDEEEDEEEIATKVNGKVEESEEKSSEDDSDNEDDDDEEESDEDDDDDEENVTTSDMLRNAISQALIANNSTAGVDDDMASVDLNEMTEEEGRKLDEALANAFKALRKTGGSNSSQTKKSKGYRVKTTTIMHFRIRVLDLIEIYLQQRPSLLISIEIMLALFNMLEYCVGDELRPLQAKVEKVLCKLTSHKNYTSEDMDIKEENFVDFLRLVVEKKAPSNVYEIFNKMRNKCSCFLIMNANKIFSDTKAESVSKLCQEYTQEFINSRNPTINITLLSDIFKLRWLKTWHLAENLSKQGLNLNTRTFRRIQIYEILTQLYKNHELQKLDEDLCRKYFKRIEKTLIQHINILSENSSLKKSTKEFQTLLNLLLTAHKTHQRLQLQSMLISESNLNALQNFRKLIRLETHQLYQSFCNTFKLQVIRNADLTASIHKQQNDSDSENELGSKVIAEPEAASKALKHKLSSKDLRKLKKQKKQQRLEAASRGLNGGIGFTQRNAASKKMPEIADDAESEEVSD